MFLDLLNQENSRSYNILIANMFGLEAAVYISELMAINGKAIKKKKIEKIGKKTYFTVDRDYIKSITTITPHAQEEIDAKLKEVNILEISRTGNDDKLMINYDILAGLFGEDIEKDTATTIKEIAGRKKTAEEKAEDKVKGQIKRAIGLIKGWQLEPQLEQVFIEWAEVIIDKHGYLSQPTITENIKDVLNFTKSNTSLAVQLVSYTRDRVWVHTSLTIQKYQTGEITFARNAESDRIRAQMNLEGESF